MEHAYAGMESLVGDFDHIITLTKGFEDLHEDIKGNSESQDDALYTDTVLKLNDIDLTSVVGEEGFLDSIKRGAGKIKEWIMNLIRSIRSWLKGDADKKYEEAKKDLAKTDAGEGPSEKVVAEKALDIIKEDPKVSAPLRRMPESVKSQIRDAITDFGKGVNGDTKEKGSFTISDPNKSSFYNTAVNRMSEMVARLLRTVQVHTKEIARIDPNGEARKELGLNNWDFNDEQTARKIFLFDREVQSNFIKRVGFIIEDTDLKEGDLNTAIKNLERLNNEAKLPDNQLSRCAAVVKEMTAIVAKMKDMVISINSRAHQEMMTLAGGVVRDALAQVQKDSDEATAKYIKQAMDAL